MQLYNVAGNICFKSKLSLTGTLENAIIFPNAHRGQSKRARGRINR